MNSHLAQGQHGSVARLWPRCGLVQSLDATGSTVCCIRHGWKWTSPMPKAKEEQIPQDAAAQTPDKFVNSR